MSNITECTYIEMNDADINMDDYYWYENLLGISPLFINDYMEYMEKYNTNKNTILSKVSESILNKTDMIFGHSEIKNKVIIIANG